MNDQEPIGQVFAQIHCWEYENKFCGMTESCFETNQLKHWYICKIKTEIRKQEEQEIWDFYMKLVIPLH